MRSVAGWPSRASPRRCSDTGRCAASARPPRRCCAGAGWSGLDPEQDDGWDEFDHLAVVAALPDRVDAELDRRAFQRRFEQATARWTEGRDGDEYAETFAGFVDRVGGALERATAAARSGQTAVVVTSGGPIAAACAGLTVPGVTDPAMVGALWSRFNTVVVNSSVTRVLVGAGGARLLTFNEHTHLDRDLVTYR